MRHPIKTLRALIEMGAKECTLTLKEAKQLVENYEELYSLADKDCVEPAGYGMDED
jgi:hypothetical protein